MQFKIAKILEVSFMNDPQNQILQSFLIIMCLVLISSIAADIVQEGFADTHVDSNFYWKE
jgi:hypothetical protein